MLISLGCEAPIYLSNIILGVSVTIFLDETNIWLSILSKANSPPYCGWASFNQLKARIKQKATASTPRKRKFLLPDHLWTGASGISFWPAFRLNWKHRSSPNLQPAGLLTGRTPSALPVLRALDLNWKYTIGSPVSPAGQLTLQTLALVGLHNHMN